MLMGGTRISDEAVKAKTGKDWKQWFSILDKAGATKMSHKEIAEYLYEKRGLREKHQKADGYAVSASRTYKVPISVLFKHWSDEKLRRQWLKDKIAVRKATANKSMRITWLDNSHVDVYFYEKGRQRARRRCSTASLAILRRSSA